MKEEVEEITEGKFVLREQLVRMAEKEGVPEEDQNTTIFLDENGFYGGSVTKRVKFRPVKAREVKAQVTDTSVTLIDAESGAEITFEASIKDFTVNIPALNYLIEQEQDKAKREGLENIKQYLSRARVGFANPHKEKLFFKNW